MRISVVSLRAEETLRGDVVEGMVREKVKEIRREKKKRRVKRKNGLVVAIVKTENEHETLGFLWVYI